MGQTNINAPLINNNDDAVQIVMWHVEVGEFVQRGQIVVTVETSKAAVDVEAPDDGFLRWKGGFLDDVVPVESTLAILTDSADERYLPPEDSPQNGMVEQTETRKATLKARVLAGKLGVKLEDIDLAEGMTITEQVVSDFVARCATKKQDRIKVANKSSSESTAAVIVGDGAHAKYLYDVCRRSGVCHIIGCVSTSLLRGERVGEMEVVGSDDDLPVLYTSGVRLALVGVGSSRSGTRSNDIRIRVFDRLKEIGFILPVVVDSDASLSATATLGEGTVVGAGAVVSNNVVIGRNCLINVGAIVCHDSVIEDHVHITPGAILAGGVFVGEGSTIGMGATILDGTRVGKNCLVPNNFRVIRDLADGMVAYEI